MPITIYHGPYDESIYTVFSKSLPELKKVAIQKEEATQEMHIQWMGDKGSILDNMAVVFLRSSISERVLSNRARHVGYAVQMLSSSHTMIASTIKDAHGEPHPSFLNEVKEAIQDAHSRGLDKVKKVILAAAGVAAMSSVAGGVAWVATQPVDRDGMQKTTEITQEIMEKSEHDALLKSIESPSFF